jgi:preprotein translocase subunit SecG
MISRALTFITLLMSTAALVISLLAYQRAGGDIRAQIGKLQQIVQSSRQETANALDRIEKFVSSEDIRKARWVLKVYGKDRGGRL